MKEWQEFISRVDVFFGLSGKEREALLAGARKQDVKRKETLFSADAIANHLYVITRGTMKTVRGNAHGQQLLVDFLKPGEVLGEESVLLSGEHGVDAVSFESASVLSFPADSVKKMLTSQPRLGHALASLAASRARAYRERLYLMTATPVPVRLAQALYMLARRFGRRDKQGTMIALRITHQDLADYVGASRETVSLFLSRFRKDGLIVMNVRRIIVPDLKALKKVTK
ncbi:MAG TPA: Crp/Fnr family transcriptional regulator [bacterium]|nr:Crp/Fnr family transcriptional regulator [bacterium]